MSENTAQPTTTTTTPATVTVKYDDFAKADIRVGNIIEANDHPNADKLLVLKVRLGDDVRQIVAGVKQHYEKDKLVGKQIIVVANLEPRKVRGVESHGMLLAASDGSGVLSLITPDKQIAAGSQVR
jgi:methionyl-tRNA synthetase